MNDKDIFTFLKEQDFSSIEEAFESLRGHVLRDHLRDLWRKYRGASLEESIAKNKDVIQNGEDKLFFDIEVAPAIGAFYDAYRENSIQKILEPIKVIAFSWAFGDEKVHGMTLADYLDYDPEQWKQHYHVDDRAIVKDLHDILSRAQIAIGHNSNKYDFRVANARFWFYDLEPLEKKVKIDTLKESKFEFMLLKNNLGEQAQFKGIGDKTKLKHSDLVWDCLNGDMEAWKKEKTYCNMDVEIDRRLYNSQKGFYTRHPNLSFITRGEQECKVCHAKELDELPPERWQFARTGARKAYRCKSCKHLQYGEYLKDNYEKIKTY